MKLKDKGSLELASSRHVGECWYIDWARKFYERLSKN